VVEAPLFAEPKSGSVYIQMGAVEKGVSVIFAEGLRSHGLTAFVAPGPNEKIFRVLIGPLPDPAAYTKAKDVVDKIGLATFARRFPN
jgi:cell division septation protein DedD